MVSANYLFIYFAKGIAFLNFYAKLSLSRDSNKLVGLIFKQKREFYLNIPFLWKKIK